QVEKKILFRQGSILRAQSNQESEKLGQILIKKNLIRPVELEIGLTQQKEIVKKLGEVLLDMNLIKQSVLTNTLVSQTRDIIFSLVDWEDGEYRLSEGADVSGEQPLDQIYTPEIILQGMRRISNVALLLKPISDLQGILRLSSDYLERIRKITLLTEEKSLLALLHQPQSLNDLVKASGIEKLSVYRSVAALLAVDVIEQNSAMPAYIPEKEITKGSSARSKSGNLPATRTSVKGRRNLLGEMLVNHNVISEQQLKEALAVQSSSRDSRKQFLGNVLVQMGYCTEEAIVSCLSTQLRVEEIRDIEVAEEVKKLIPFNVAKRYYICPMRKRGYTLDVAMLDPTNMSALDDLSFLTSLRIQPFITTNQALQEAWRKLYGYMEEKSVQKFQKQAETRRELMYRNFAEEEEEGPEDEFSLAEQDAEGLDMGDLESLVTGVVEELQIVPPDDDTAPRALDVDDAPVVKLVNTILRQAIKMGASDIHVEPWENKLQVRFRIDGVLH
ncbi:MAG TPA: DUF4388 domain-containing protein, partial [Acidobacteriota bacterium]